MDKALTAAQKAEVFFKGKNDERKEHKKPKKISRSKIFWFSLIPILLIIATSSVFWYPQTFALNIFQEKTSNLGPEDDIIMNFNFPIIPKNLSEKISFEPSQEGTIRLINNSKTLVFSPKQPFESSTTYKIKLSDIKSVFGTKIENQTLIFKTQDIPLPKISDIKLEESEEFNTDLNTKIILTLQKDDPSFEFKFQLEPNLSHTLSQEGNTIIINPTEELKPDTIYSLQAFTRYKTHDERTGAWLKHNFSTSFNTYSKLKISELYPYNKSINIALRQSIYIHLNRNIEDFDFQRIKDSLEISPEIQGKSFWENDSTLLFNPSEDLKPDTLYTVTVQYDYDKSYTSTFKTTEPKEISSNMPEAPEAKITEGRFIDINLSTQSLYAFEDGKPLFSTLISGGLYYTPSPQGDFKLLEKVENKRYVGSNRDGSRYDFPNTKFNLRFHGPYWIHSAYWHNNFGNPMSHGCINLPLEAAEWIYNWSEVGDSVYVHP